MIVDLLAAQFANDRLHAHTLHAHARADRIDVLVAASHRYLRAFARLACRMANLYRAVVNLRTSISNRRCTRLASAREVITCGPFAARSTALMTRVALADVVSLEPRLFALRQPRFRPAHIHDQVRALCALHNHRHSSPRGCDTRCKSCRAPLRALFAGSPAWPSVPRCVQHIGGLHVMISFLPPLPDSFLRVRYAYFALRIHHFLDHGHHREHVHLPVT